MGLRREDLTTVLSCETVVVILFQVVSSFACPHTCPQPARGVFEERPLHSNTVGNVFDFFPSFL